MTEIKTLHVGYLRTNCYILYGDDGRCVITDPGGSPTKIIGFLEGENLKPEAVLLTHAHFDHILGIPGLTEHYPELRLYGCEQERQLFESAALNLSESMHKPVTLDGINYLGDGDEIEAAGIKLRLIHTPGHTAGSCCFYDEKEGILLSGDTLFRESCGRTDFPTGSEADIVNSIKNVLMKLPDETRVYPGHEAATDIGHERRYNFVMTMY